MQKSTSTNRLPRQKWEYTGSHDDRLLKLLETGYRSDLVLEIRPEGVKIPVHKIFLEANSPVLDDMITADMKELIIDNVEIHVFTMLLKFLYTGKSGVEKGDALELMKVATTYGVTGLRDECAAVLEGDLNLENVLSFYQSGMKQGAEDFIQASLKFICENAPKVLKSVQFTTLREECLIKIIQQDDLNVENEMEVFEAVNRWGREECTRQSLNPESIENLRNCVAKPLNHIRFPLMDCKEFAVKVASKELLVPEECIQLLTAWLLPLEKRIMWSPTKFDSTPRRRINSSRNIILEFARHPTPGRRQLLHLDYPDRQEHITIRTNRKLLLKSMHIPREILSLYGPSFEYSFHLLMVNITASTAHQTNSDLMNQIVDMYEDCLQVLVTPGYELGKETSLTISFAGQVSYEKQGRAGHPCVLGTRGTYHISEMFSAGRSYVTTNYGDFETKSILGGKIEIEGNEGLGIIEKIVCEVV